MSAFRFKKRGVQGREEMHHPSRQAECYSPDDSCQAELKERHERSALEQLAEPGNEKTAERRDYISCRALSCHFRKIEILPWFQQGKTELCPVEPGFSLPV